MKMSENWVQRYDVRYAHDIIQMKKGEFVTYEAYEKLQAENEKLKDELGLARGDLVPDKDTGKLVRAYKLAKP